MSVERKYTSNNLYVGNTDKNPFCLFVERNNKFYVVLKTDIKGYMDDREIDVDNINITSSFNEYLENNKLSILLCGSDGLNRQSFSIEEIEKILKLVRLQNKIDPRVREQMKLHATDSAKKIADLLGINSKINPNSNLKIVNEEVIVKAQNVKNFIIYLSDFIYSFMLESVQDIHLIMTNEYEARDYRIVRSLNKASIPVTEELCSNCFTVMIDYRGNITKIELKKEHQKVYKI